MTAELKMGRPFLFDNFSEMVALIWGDEFLVGLERQLWILVMEHQEKHGLVSKAEIEASERVRKVYNPLSIQRRESVTKHDLKARVEEFAELSGHEKVHVGLTSSDIVENSYSIRILLCADLLGLRDPSYPWLPPLRGFRGPVGSDADLLGLLGSEEAVRALNQQLADEYGFDNVANAVGQNLPRSYDSWVVVKAIQALDKAAVRRVDARPYRLILQGCLTMASAQEYWLEGDVATSCVRRYLFPLLFSTLAEYKDLAHQGQVKKCLD